LASSSMDLMAAATGPTLLRISRPTARVRPVELCRRCDPCSCGSRRSALRRSEFSSRRGAIPSRSRRQAGAGAGPARASSGAWVSGPVRGYAGPDLQNLIHLVCSGIEHKRITVKRPCGDGLDWMVLDGRQLSSRTRHQRWPAPSEAQALGCCAWGPCCCGCPIGARGGVVLRRSAIAAHMGIVDTCWSASSRRSAGRRRARLVGEPTSGA
jgi:hypothetical protein